MPVLGQQILRCDLSYKTNKYNPLILRLTTVKKNIDQQSNTIRTYKKLETIQFIGLGKCPSGRHDWYGAQHLPPIRIDAVSHRFPFRHIVVHWRFWIHQSVGQLFYWKNGQFHWAKKPATFGLAHRHSRTLSVDLGQ